MKLNCSYDIMTHLLLQCMFSIQDVTTKQSAGNLSYMSASADIASTPVRICICNKHLSSLVPRLRRLTYTHAASSVCAGRNLCLVNI